MDPADKRYASTARAALFILLWFAATSFFFGNLGKWMDDWSFHARDVAADRIIWSKLLAIDPINTRFWRPFHIHAAIALETIFWRHDWVIHLTLALIHGLNAWLLWRILTRLCTSKQAPALGALLFLVCPAGHEAIYWNSTIGTTVGVWWLLACILAVQRFAAGEISWRALLLRAPLLLTLGWWYEQAAACAPVIAAAYLACAPHSIPIRKRLTNAASLVVAALLAGAIYAFLMVATTNPNARGGAQSITRLGEFMPQLRLILSQAWDHITLADFARGALAEGWRAISSRPVESLVLGAALAGAFLAFGSWWMRASEQRTALAVSPTASGDAASRRIWGFLMGAGIVAASMVPAIAVHGQWFAARLAYTPAMGLLIMLAIAADFPLAAPWAQRAGAPGRTIRALSLTSLIAATLLGAAMLIGVQSVWHTRAALDRRIASELRRVIPAPPPDAVFAPVQVRLHAIATGSHAFDAIGAGPLEFHWSAPSFIRSVYHRADVHALASQAWLPPGHRLVGVVGATESGLVLEPRILAEGHFARGSGDTRIIPWDRFIPIRLLKAGVIATADAVRIEDDSNPANDRSVWLPSGGAAPNSSPPSNAWAALLAAAPSATPPTRTEWKLVGSDGRSPTEQQLPAAQSAANRSYAVFTLHPAVGSIPDRSELRATLDPSDHPRTLSLRAALFDYTKGLTDGVTVSIELEGNDKPLAMEPVTHERLQQQRAWIVLQAVIPPASQPLACRVVVRPGAAGDPNADWCLITPPVLSPAPSENVSPTASPR